MNRTRILQRRGIGFLVMLCMSAVMVLTVGQAWAIKQGMVIAIQSGQDQWVEGALVLVTTPSLQKKTLLASACSGPCFSPDASKIAVVQNGVIKTLNIDGTNVVSTGMNIRTGAGPGHPYSGYTALYWLSIGGVEYLYWFDGNASATYRAKVGTWQKETLHSGTNYFWGGFSKDGKRAAATKEGWSVTKIDMTNFGSAVGIHPGLGCNVSISPDGQYIWHLLNGRNDEGDLWGGAEHEYSMIRRYSDGSEYKKIDSHCNHDTNRWSHFDNDILLYHHNNYGNGSVCDSDGNFGVVMTWSTDERFCIGTNLEPFDFYPGSVTPPPAQCNPVDFTPTPGKYPIGPMKIKLSTTTTGASIRYTTNGTSPTSTTGTLRPAPPNDSVSITINATDTVTVKAIAYKAGTDSSGVGIAKYYAALPPFTITTPKTGDVLRIGDSLRIKWTTRTGYDVRSSYSISVDDGITFYDLGPNVFPGTPQWQNVAVKIPPSIQGQSLVYNAAIVRVQVYANLSDYALSGTFAIQAALGTVHRSDVNGAGVKAAALKNGVMHIPMRSSQPGAWSVDIHTMNGALVYRVGGNAAPAEVVWNGVGRSGVRVPAGLYYVAVRQGTQAWGNVFSLAK